MPGRQCPGGHNLSAERHTAEGCESTGGNTGKSCSGLLWAAPGNESSFCFLPPAAGPAGACWAQAGGKASCCCSWGIYWEEESLFLSLCKSNDPRDLALGEVKRCGFESGWCGSSAAPEAVSLLLWPPHCSPTVPISVCLSVSPGSTRPVL